MSRWLPRISRGAAGGGGGNTEDIRSYRVIVGNELEGDTEDVCDVLDPGDGSGIASALSAASSRTDIFLRSGIYTLTSVTAPLAVPEGVRLIGAGEGSIDGLGGGDPQTEIVGPDQDDQQILTLAANASLEEMRLTNPTPEGETSGASPALVLGSGGGQRIIRCTAFMQPAGSNERTQVEFFAFDDKSLVRVHQCSIFGAPKGGQQPFPPTRGVRLTGTSGPSIITESVVAGFNEQVILDGDQLTMSDCLIEQIPDFGRGLGVISAQGAETYTDVRIINSRFSNAGAGIGVEFVPQDGELRYCLIANCFFTGSDSSDSGIVVGSPLGNPIVRAAIIRGCAFQDLAEDAIRVESAGRNTIVTENEMSQSTGKIADSSATTELAHNLLT